MRSLLNKKRSLFFFLTISLISIGKLNGKAEAESADESFAQEKENYEYSYISNKDIQTKFGGYIKAEYFYDSRQVLGYSTEQILLFPLKADFDPAGNDKNARGKGHAVAIESQISFEFFGTKIGCANLSGILEGDFWLIPKLETDPISGDLFRLRHAAIFLDWNDLKLTMGQYWHPIWVKECYPHTVGYNKGLPFEPLARAPQISVDYDYDGFHFIGCASYQLDYSNIGPVVLKETDLFVDAGNPKYAAQSLVPNIHFSFKKLINEHGFGAGIDYNRIVPRLVSDEGFAVIEPLSSVNAFAWMALNWHHKFELHSKVTYAQNATQYKLLGGFGTHSIECPDTGRRTYSNINSLNFWWDLIAFPECCIEPAVFIGYAKNVGSLKTIIPDDLVFGIGVQETKGSAIDHLIRVSPRCRWQISKELTLAAEFEFTRAAYGTINTEGEVGGIITPVNNFRGMLATFYWF